MNKITDEQVQEEYDRLVKANDPSVVEPIVKDNSFVLPDLDKLLEGSDGSNSGDAPGLPSDDAPAPPSGEAPVPSDDAPAPPSSEVPAAETTPAMETPAIETPPATGTTPAVEVPNLELPKVEVPSVEFRALTPDAAPVVPENSSYSVRGTQAQFVSVQEPTGGSMPSDLQAVEPATQVVEPATQVVEPAAQAVETTPAAGETPASQTENQTPATTTDSVELPQADRPQTGGIGTDIDEEIKKQEAAPERKYKPLTDVAESIRRNLALPKANVKMSEGIELAKYEIDDYFGELEIWESDVANGSNDPKPAVPDFEKLAKRHGLQLKQTGLVDREELRKDPFGSIKLGPNYWGDYLIFKAGDRDLYEAELFGGASAFVPDYYAFWLIENDEPHVSEFAECKDQVIDFWKKQEALKLALQEAESISKNVNDVRKSKMSELYPDRALPTGQFSWFKSVRGGSILSQPGNVEKPSDDFMETAFSLVELESGVAVDQNQDTVYVIQSISGNRPVEELGADYLQNKFMKFKQVPREVFGAVGYYGRQERIKAGEELEKELGFEYESNF